MYFLELLEKLDDMKEKSGFLPSLLSSFFTFNVLIDQKFKDECTISRAIPLLPLPPQYGDFILKQ